MACELHEELKETISDHEARIRELEKSNMKQENQLLNIEKNQAELKATMLEINKEQSKTLNEFMKKILDTLTSTISNNNKVKFYNRKELWAVISLVAGAVVTYFLK